MAVNRTSTATGSIAQRLTFLQYAAGGLHGRRNVADFIQKKRAAVGQRQPPGFVPPASVNAPPYSRTARFQQRVRQGRN